MSRIKYYSTKKDVTDFLIYRDKLQYYLTKVLSRVLEKDDDIIWVICEEDDIRKIKSKKGNAISDIFKKINRQPRYGLTKPCRNGLVKIYISKEAIDTAPYKYCDLLSEWFPQKTKRNTLTDVIMDELAHAKTLKDHGDDEYDKKLRLYHDRYNEMRVLSQKYGTVDRY